MSCLSDTVIDLIILSFLFLCSITRSVTKLRYVEANVYAWAHFPCEPLLLFVLFRKRDKHSAFLSLWRLFLYRVATGLTSSVENHHDSGLSFWFPGVGIWKCTERSFIFLWPGYQGGEMIMICLNQSGVAVMESGSSGLYVQCSTGN